MSLSEGTFTMLQKILYGNILGLLNDATALYRW